MFVYTELEPHLVFLILLLVATWSFGTWLTWQNRKLYCELVPKYEWVSKYGLVIGTFTMIFTLWFLSLFYNELRLGMTIIFASITVVIGNYLARFLEWLVFIQDIDIYSIISQLNNVYKSGNHLVQIWCNPKDRTLQHSLLKAGFLPDGPIFNNGI